MGAKTSANRWRMASAMAGSKGRKDQRGDWPARQWARIGATPDLATLVVTLTRAPKPQRLTWA